MLNVVNDERELVGSTRKPWNIRNVFLCPRNSWYDLIFRKLYHPNSGSGLLEEKNPCLLS